MIAADYKMVKLLSALMPGMHHSSAMVFDSPGSVDVMRVLNSTMESEQGRIALGQLYIHNFCAMPRLVSTYGTHTSSLWYLAEPVCCETLISLAICISHMLSSHNIMLFKGV